MSRYGTVAIIGVGLIGGSVGLALKRGGLADKVIGIGHRKPSLELALEKGAVDETTLDAKEGVVTADIVILATPISLIKEISREIMPALKSGALLTDVGSTKGDIVRHIESFVREDVFFIGGHPIAGSEKRGVGQARADLFDNSICVITPSDGTPEGKVGFLRRFWSDLGCRVEILSVQEHDRILAYVSHLPHLVAAGLASEGLLDSYMPFVGPGFKDTTRIAASDAKVWKDVFLSNREEVLRSLEEFEKIIAKFRKMIDKGEAEELEKELLRIAARRKKLDAGSQEESDNR